MDVTPFRLVWREHGNPECGVQVMRLDPHGDTAEHDHLFLELALVERGEAIHLTAKGTEVVRAGQVMLIRPQVWHGYRHCTSDMVVINCLISQQAIAQIQPLLSDVEGAEQLLRQRNARRDEPTPLVLTPNRGLFGRMRDTLHTMLDEQHAREAGWQAANIGQLLQVLALLVRTMDTQATAPRLPERTAAAIRQAAAIVERSYRQRISLEEVAAAVDLSPAHLSRNFKRQMGIGLVDYTHRLRVEEACRLLRLTDWPIARVAGQVGYDEIAYFSRCFRARIGRSPSNYRQG